MVLEHSDKMKTDEQVKLDTAKLLGFRNLSVVMGPKSDIRESADLAFTKRGTETLA